MLNRVISVDFGKRLGKIKPLHAINGGPHLGLEGLKSDFGAEFSEIGVPFVRTSGVGEYGNNQFVNIHCIFPDFNADENLEESYNFLPTDEYLSSIRDTGAEIFFRLGESPEPYPKKLYTLPKVSPEKWASVCEHIIMHYNEGWAGGFKMKIKYFEIWSGADTALGFSGSAEDYYRLYRTAALRLKERFPKIKIGAYGSLGFASLNRLDATEEMREAVPFMQKFFSYVKSDSKEVPLDFFTWCCYTSNPDELAMHIKYARSYLDLAGLKKTKSIVSEYNTSKKINIPPALRDDFPSELGASLILAQKSPLDMMMYSTSEPWDFSNGLFSLVDFTSHRKYAGYNVLLAFGKLYKLGRAVETTGDYRKEVYALASAGNGEGAILLVTRSYEGRVEIILKNSEYSTATVVKTVPGGAHGEGTVYRAENVSLSGQRLAVAVKPNEIYLVTLFN